MLGPSGKGLAPAAEEEVTCEVYAMMVIRIRDIEIRHGVLVPMVLTCRAA
jgi:hypothetical protein